MAFLGLLLVSMAQRAVARSENSDIKVETLGGSKLHVESGDVLADSRRLSGTLREVQESESEVKVEQVKMESVNF